MSSKSAIYPGTFDPLTLGHMDIIRRASVLFDNIIVAIAMDTPKTTLFPLEERVDMVKHEVKKLELGNVQVKSFSGLLIKFAAQEQIYVIIRGIRALSDFEYEFKMSYMNHKLDPKIQTILLPSTETGSFISSSFVKEIAKMGGAIDGFVSQYVRNKISKILKGE